MKDICEALYEYLSKDSDVKAIIGNRLYPVLLPQNAPLPSVVYTPVLAGYDFTLTGETMYVRQNIQFNCHGKTFKKARELSRLVKRKLQNYHGNMCGLQIEAVYIKSDFLSDSNTALKFDTDEYMSVIELEFNFNEK